MLAFFRNFSKSWVANLLLSVVIISFAIWGIKDVFHPQTTTAVVTAGSHKIEPAAFKRVFEQYRKQAAQQTGQLMSAADAVAQGIDLHLVQAVSVDEAMAELVKRMGLTASDQLVADELKKQPAFFDQVTGKFDEQAYEQTLTRVGVSPTEFQATLADEIAQDHMATGLAAGLKQPLAYGALIASLQLEGRTLSYFLIDPRTMPLPDKPTDQQLHAFMTEHADQLRRPEMRMLSVVRFSAKALAPTLTPNPADLQKMYNFRKDSLSTPEKRTLVQIPARDAATAQSIIAKLKAGQSPEAVAKAIGVQPVNYVDAPKTAVADEKVADAAFQLAAGQVSGPVQTSLAGLAVVKLTAVTPAKAPNFDDLKPQLEAQSRSDLANSKINDQVQKYDNSHAAGANLTEAARAAGTTPVQLGPISAGGGDSKGQPIPGLSPKLLKEAFAIGQGAETDMEDDGAGEYFAVHVDKVIAPAVPALDEIRAPLTQYWMAQELVRRMNARADELAAKLRKGETLEAAAAEAKSQVGHVVGVTRMALQQNRMLGQALGAKLLTAKAGEIVTGQTSQMPVMVARIDTIRPPEPAEAARMVVAQRGRGSVQVYNDLGELLRTVAKTQIKPTYDLTRARIAMGLSADDAAKAPTDSSAKPAGAKPKRAS